MIDRTELDTRIANHTRRVVRAGSEAWRLETAPSAPRLRPWLAAALGGLAARISPATTSPAIKRSASA